MELDKSDRSIISKLMENSRASLNKIAKASKLSKETVNYRINRMTELGLIKSFHVVLNTELLGDHHYVIFLQLVNLTTEKEERFLAFLKTIDIHWASLIAGKWNLMFDIYVKTEEELSDKLQKILNHYSGFVREYNVISVENEWYYSKKLIGKKEPLIWKKESSQIIPALDEIDWKIIGILGKNARTSYVDITREIPLTANGIKKRILRLEKKGIILGYSISIDYRKLGYEGYGIQLKLLNYQKEKLKEIINFLEKNDKVAISYKYLSGQWDFDIRVIVKDSKEFRSFISELYNKFSKDLKISDFYLILEEKIL